jgi:protein-S-isoprenylcysteine O-methyltransferase Ste14
VSAAPQLGPAASPITQRIPPVAVTLLIASLMWAASAAVPAWRVEVPGREFATLALVALAGTVGLAGLRAFRLARTTSNPLRPDRASALVTTGIYRRTRNPMYVALAIALLAWVVWLGHALAVPGVAAFVAWMNRFQIAAEERALRALFGEEFERYCRDVPRWL